MPGSGRVVIAFSSDGSKLALGDGETVSVFDLVPLTEKVLTDDGNRSVHHPLLTLERPDPSRQGTHADKQAEHWLPPVAFDNAGRTLFTLGLRNRVQRIDLATGGVMCEWGWRCEPIRSLAVSPDDLTAAAGCQRGELVLWDLE
jgi:WD40 repeat protein